MPKDVSSALRKKCSAQIDPPMAKQLRRLVSSGATMAINGVEICDKDFFLHPVSEKVLVKFTKALAKAFKGNLPGLVRVAHCHPKNELPGLVDILLITEKKIDRGENDVVELSVHQAIEAAGIDEYADFSVHTMEFTLKEWLERKKTDYEGVISDQSSLIDGLKLRSTLLYNSGALSSDYKGVDKLKAYLGVGSDPDDSPSAEIILDLLKCGALVAINNIPLSVFADPIPDGEVQD